MADHDPGGADGRERRDDPTLSVGLRRAREADAPGSTLMEADGTVLDTDRNLASWEAAPEADRPLASYRLGRVVGRGGQGEVLEATQEALGRAVAVKRLRSDIHQSATPGERALLKALFLHEALTTARLDHPNVVPVHDLGLDASGRPLLAMKLVKGRSWEDALSADFPQMAPADFLARHLPILMDVGQAVAFAHANGVVHRDLKPSQVMVGEFGEVLLMDWGLALAWDAERRQPALPALDGGRASLTLTSPAGTPVYMAPEQTESTVDRVGPWTDVYLLGGILYYLLTGHRPHEAGTTADAMALAASGEVDPPQEVAPEREVPAELAALAMKSLAREPGERPASAEAFVRELQDHLSGANHRRESAQLTAEVAERLQKIEGEYEQFAELSARLGQARALWPENPESRPLGEWLYGEYARTALAHGDLVLARVQATRLQDEEARQGLLREVEAASVLREKRERQRRLAIRTSFGFLLALVAGSFLAMREVQRERDVARAARARAESLLAFMLADLTDSLESVGRLDILSQVARQSVRYFESLQPGELEDDVLRQRIRALRNVGEVARKQGLLAEARHAYTEALTLAEGLVRRHPADEEAQGLLWSALDRVGADLVERKQPEPGRQVVDRAEALARAALARSPDDARWADRRAASLTWRGQALRAQGRGAEALSALQEAVALRERLVARQPRQLEWQDNLGESLLALGAQQRALGRVEDALGSMRRAAQLFAALTQSDPKDATYRYKAAFALRDLGATERRLGGREAEARASLEEAQALLERLVRRDPTNVRWQQSLAVALSELGRVRLAQGGAADALVLFDKATEVRRRLYREPPSAGMANQLAWSLVLSGRAQAALGHLPQARSAWEEAVRLLEPFAAEGDAELLDTYVSALLRLGRGAEAKALAERLAATGWAQSADPETLELARAAGLLGR